MQLEHNIVYHQAIIKETFQMSYHRQKRHDFDFQKVVIYFKIVAVLHCTDTDSLGIINDYVKNHQLGHAKIQLLLSKVTSTVFSSYAKYYQQFKNHAKDLQRPC